MKSLKDDLIIYNRALQQGSMQRAYRGILTFMGDLNRSWKQKHPEWVVGSVYPGYLDMTYFPVTPPKLKEHGLKIAFVYLHRENRFEVWLAANNRRIQSNFIRYLQHKTSPFKLTPPGPGVDSILIESITDRPDFDEPDTLMLQIEETILGFVEEVTKLLP